MMVQRLVVVLLVMLFLVGCSEDPEEITIVEGESIEDLIIQLGDSDSYIANKASERLVKKGRKAVPELLKVLDLPDTNSRHELVISIFRKMKSSDKDVLEAIAKYEKRKAPVANLAKVIPPNGSDVAADVIISVVFDNPVESVIGAWTGSGKNWTIPVRDFISKASIKRIGITWTNINGTHDGPIHLHYRLIPL